MALVPGHVLRNENIVFSHKLKSCIFANLQLEAECQIVAEHASAARRHGGLFVGRREREHEKK